MPSALIVDDHPFLRATVRLLLEQAGVDVVGEAEDGVCALQLARALEPDLILLDISLPRLDGLNVLRRLRLLHLTSRILMLSSQPSQIYSRRCDESGAHGYLCKTAELSQMSDAIATVLRGDTFFPLREPVVRPAHLQAVGEMELVSGLSNREVIVLQQLALGRSNKEISELMIISQKTVSTYKTRILQKVGVESVVNLSHFAKRTGLI